MRRFPAALAGAAIATGLATTVALSANAAPPDGSAKQSVRQAVGDELPNPAEEKRRELRETALLEVIAGKA